MKFIVGKTYKSKDGYDFRVLCTDAPGNRPIVAINEIGFPRCFTLKGRIFSNGSCGDDLVPPTEKRTGWLNVYSVKKTEVLHPTLELANLCSDSGRLACIKITYEVPV